MDKSSRPTVSNAVPRERWSTSHDVDCFDVPLERLERTSSKVECEHTGGAERGKTPSSCWCRCGIAALAAAGGPFIKDQYRHCKPILALGASAQLLTACGIDKTLPNGKSDPGLIAGNAGAAGAQFITAIAEHRHLARETDPPRV